MPKNNGRTRKEERRDVADRNARANIIDCVTCGRRHRESRACDSKDVG